MIEKIYTEVPETSMEKHFNEAIALRKLSQILKEYQLTLSEEELDAIAGGTFDLKEFIEKFELKNRKRPMKKRLR